jgi:hypothetical protein
MKFQLLFSAVHERCGQDLIMIDYRVKSREDFAKIARGELKPLSIFCNLCAEHVQPGFYEVWEIEGSHIVELVGRRPIENLTSTSITSDNACAGDEKNK